jgi:hypothetical protein
MPSKILRDVSSACIRPHWRSLRAAAAWGFSIGRLVLIDVCTARSFDTCSS